MTDVSPTPMRSYRIVLAGLLEPAVRISAWIGPLVGRDREGVEQVLRGWLLGGRAHWRVGRGVRFVGPPARFAIGRDVCFQGNCYLNANGPAGAIQIGAHSHVDQYCVLYGQGGLSVGRECAVASGVVIYSQTNADSLQDGTPVTRQPAHYARVEIGDGCWLGAGVRVIPGVTIGGGCHVGAGAVVIGDLPKGSIAVGVPAKPVRHRRFRQD